MKRSKDLKHLPSRWRILHNAFYYAVPVGMEKLWDGKQLFRLGHVSEPREAYAKWADRMHGVPTDKSMNGIFDKYLLNGVPLLAKKTQVGYKAAIENLRPVFGDCYPDSVTSADVCRYFSKRKAKVAAKREIATLSAALSFAVECGDIEMHPFKGNMPKLKAGKARDRYVEDWEVLEVLNMPSTSANDIMIQNYLRLKLLTGMSRGDLLRLKMDQLQADGIHIKRHKTENSTGKKTIYRWDDLLRGIVEAAKKARPCDSEFLFCNRLGEGYMNEETGEPEGFKTAWARFMKRVLSETKVKLRFTEHDLRAKVSSDEEDVERARALLSHSSVTTTRKHYRRKAEIVPAATQQAKLLNFLNTAKTVPDASRKPLEGRG
jgi:integrase